MPDEPPTASPGERRSRGRSARRSPFPRALPDSSPALERVIEQRYAAALATVSELTAEHPGDTPEQLADRLIRRYAKDMAIGGAVAGGAAAAPVAGMAVAAASAGVESAYSVGRLGELIMAIGLLYGHAPTSADERKAAVLAVMGMADGAAVGVSGLAARAGSRGGARLLQRLPSGAAGATSGTAGRRALSRLGSGKGPWSVAALVPYGIGAGVGAAGNALLVRAVGRAAKEYYAAEQRRLRGSERPWPDDPSDDVPVDGEPIEDDPAGTGTSTGEPGADAASRWWTAQGASHHDDVVDAEVVDPPATS